MVAENLKAVESRISAACQRAGREREDVTLIAVSKTKPETMIEEAYDVGQRDFGENKVQELIRKRELLPEDIRWHLIGHLQTNKVRAVVDKTCLIHSVDSLHLAEAISKEAVKKGCTASILVEVNVAGENTKFGVAPEETIHLVEDIAALPNLKVEGLMTIAPFVDDPEDNRPIFSNLKKLSVDIAAKNVNNVCMRVLSMGMTNDYEVAIEEGSTMVRVGTGIFGERDYAAGQ